MDDGVFEGSNFGLSFNIDFNALGAKDIKQKTEDVISALRTAGADAAKVEQVLRSLAAAWGAVRGASEKATMSGASSIYEAIEKSKSFLGKDKIDNLQKHVQNMLDTRLRNAGTVDPDGDGGGGGGEKGVLAKAARFLRIGGRLTMQFNALVRATNAFVEASSRVNRELFLMATNAQTTVAEVAKIGGALEAFGGKKGEAVNFMRGYEQEMAKMRVGEGVGGRYLEAARKYGIRFVANDFKAQELEIVKFLSDPSKSKTQKVGFASELGLSAAQVSMYSRGVAEFQAEQKRQEDLSQHAEAAAKATDEYKRSMQHLSAAWQDMKSAALIPVQGKIGSVTEKFSELAQELSGTVIGDLAVFVGYIAQLVPHIARMAATARMAGWIGGGTAAAGGVGTTIKNMTVNGGGGGKGGASSAISGLIGALSSAITGSMSVEIGAGQYKVTSEMSHDLNKYFGRQTGVMVALQEEYRKSGDSYMAEMVGKYAGSSNKTVAWHSFDILKFKFIERISGTTEEILGHLEFMSQQTKKGTVKEEKKGASVKIEHIDISVESNSTDAEEVAEAVQQKLMLEMRHVIDTLDPGGEA